MVRAWTPFIQIPVGTANWILSRVSLFYLLIRTCNSSRSHSVVVLIYEHELHSFNVWWVWPTGFLVSSAVNLLDILILSYIRIFSKRYIILEIYPLGAPLFSLLIRSCNSSKSHSTLVPIYVHELQSSNIQIFLFSPVNQLDIQTLSARISSWRYILLKIYSLRDISSWRRLANPAMLCRISKFSPNQRFAKLYW